MSLGAELGDALTLGPSLGEDDGELLKDARFLYRHLTNVLSEAIVAIQANGCLVEREAEHLANVRKHYNALIQLINLEADLVKRSGKTERAIGGAELDLDAAREEISRRLAKLAASR